MNIIDFSITAVLFTIAGVAATLYGTQATDFAVSAIGGVKKFLQGRKTTLTGLGLKGYVASMIGSGYFQSHDAVYQMGASGLDSDVWWWLAALVASFLPDWLHAQAQRLSAEQKAAAVRAAELVEKLARDFREAMNVPPSPPNIVPPDVVREITN